MPRRNRSFAPPPASSLVRAIAANVVTLAIVTAWACTLANPAAAMVPPDPSGAYESFCHVSQAYTPVRCETINAEFERGRARLFAREYIPAVGSTPARTKIEGQITIPREVSYSTVWNEAEQKCKTFPDWPRQIHLADVYDVIGEVVWRDLRSSLPVENSISLQGTIVSDPGEFTYIPGMKFAGNVWMLPDIYSAFQSQLCVALADTPTVAMTMTYNAPAVEQGPICPASVGYPVTGCWRRTGGALPDAAGRIRGVVVSNVPTSTDTDHEVHQATIVVYEQRNGTVRARLDGESDQDYLDYLEMRGRKEVARMQIERRRDGSYSFGEPGRFEIDDIPLFRFLEELTVARWGTVWYTIEVEGAETDEEIPLEGGGTQSSRLLFKPGRAVNVRPEDPEVVIGLDPFGEIGVKRELIDRLTETCVLEYGPVEDDATLFLNDAEGGGLTNELDEAIRRGAWAERSVLGAAELAEELFETSLNGLATLLADVFSDFVKFHRADIAARRDARDRLASPPAPAAVSPFKLDTQPLAKKTQQAISGTGDERLLAQGDLASTVKKTIKSLKPSLVYWLQQAGADDAAKTADLLIRVLSVLADTIETRTTAGSLKSIIKIAISEAMKETRPLLMHGSPVSYCGVTDDELATSVAEMEAWNSFDAAVYTKDRREVVRILTEMNREATDILARMRAAQEVAAGFNTVEEAAAAIGTVAKWVKIVEKFALVTRYVLNIESFVLPLAHAYGVLPGAVDDAVTAAYASASPLALAVTPTSASTHGASMRGSRAARLAVSPDASALRSALSGIMLALDEDRIGDLTRAIFDPDASSYVEERDAYERRVRALFAQAAAAAGVFNLEVPLRESAQGWLAVESAGAELAEALRTLVVDVRAGRYTNPTDSAYVRVRDTARALAHVLDGRILDLEPDLAALRDAVDSNTFGPAALLEAFSPVSAVTGDALVSQTPETFTVVVRVTNLGSSSLANASVRIAVHSPEDSVDIVGSSEKSVATLQPFDGLGGLGGDEATLEWQLSYTGNLDWELISLRAELLENGAAPVSFEAAAAGAVLTIDASVADEDRDGMPDDFEVEHGLNPTRNDARTDLDGDGLSNVAELDLGTDPSNDDSDGDGLEDGEEMAAGQDGFVTDPLAADSDGDGVDDGDDGNPTDGGSTVAPQPAGEPVVSVSESLVLLKPDSPLAAITVSNAGAGTLLWSSSSQSASLVEASPAAGDVRDEDGLLFVGVSDDFDFQSAAALVVTVDVSDVAGAVKDSQKVKVVVGHTPSLALCGHGSDAGVGEPLKASDALTTLRASVGTFECAACRCDTDSSNTVTASDALRTLRAAVGIPVVLSCPEC